MRKLFLLLFLLFSTSLINGQKIYKYDNSEVKLIFFDKNISQYVPHLINEYTLGMARHNQLWNMPPFDTLGLYKPQQSYMYLTDWNDDGNGGVSPIPNNLIMIGMAPLNNTYDIYPSVERYRHLFSHELTHVMMTDKFTDKDNRWRRFFGAKIPTDSNSPFTVFWSYFSTPRWYAPRWYQEGIACFMETWMDGGVGRGLGTYDEMYFRTEVNSDKGLYSAVGLETEGTSADFQVGATSYLYGTRFTNYLAYRYGTDSLVRYYNRTSDSKRFFGAQFRNIYGRSVNALWDEWREFEKEHQKKNLDAITAYPLTELTPLYKKAMGSVGKPIYDSLKDRLYMAVNYKGRFAHVSYIDLKTGREKRLRNIDGPMLYRSTYIALDRKNNRLLYTIHNSNFRGIEVIDADSGKHLKRIELQRVSELVYDNKHDVLYGIMSNAGVNHIVRYDKNIENREILCSFNFGQVISDLAISDDCENLLTVMAKPDGNQTIIRLNIKNLENADFKKEEVMEIENVNLINVTYAQNDSLIICSSNYTGVQNLWSIDPESGDMHLLTNVETGIFAPVQYTSDTLIALSYQSDGFIPVKLKYQNVDNANSIELLGQKVFDKNPNLEHIYELREEPKVEFKDVYNNIESYNSFKELRFAGAFPELTGYKDPLAFNNVIPVLSYRFLFQDPVGINSIKFDIGISPWSNNPWKERFHASLSWRLWSWELNASYNKTNFYDLVGPLRRSRAGYHIGLSYSRTNSLFTPFIWDWSVGVNTYGMMDALPLFQEIKSPVTQMQTASAQIGISKMRTSLGGVVPESGYSLRLSAYSYFAALDGKYNAFPSLLLQADKGFLLPVGRNNALWIRSALGQSFGSSSSPFGNDYFGGFRNNYVDNESVLRYREVNAMPGAKIDQIPSHCFAKFTAEVAFTPIRFKNIGAPGFYPTHALFTVFSSDLIANPWGSESFKNYTNVGAQFNIEVVLFSYLKTTWSVGYAHIFGPSGMNSGEWMVSLKIL